MTISSNCTGEFLVGTEFQMRRWQNQDFSFDNVGVALLTLFQVASLSGWPSVMYAAVDVNGVGNQPARDAHPESAAFFIIFIIVGSFWSINLFAGTILQFKSNLLISRSCYY